MRLIKSPLRYPGGKSKSISKIIQYLPQDFNESWEYREPFVGGGSLFIYLAQTYPNLKIWVNDLNPELFSFWYSVKHYLPELVNNIKEFKNSNDEKSLFTYLKSINPHSLNVLDRGVRFFILNRLSFGGTTESGGFTPGRFTLSSIDNLQKLDGLLKNIKITNADYKILLHSKSNKDCFIFLDPPYLQSKGLYGKNGDLHNNFNHLCLRLNLNMCKHRWLMTYDNSNLVKTLYKSFNIKEWKLTYGLSKIKQGNKEVFIYPHRHA